MSDPSNHSHLTVAMINELVDAIRAEGLAVEQLALPGPSYAYADGPSEFRYRPTGRHVNLMYWSPDAAIGLDISPGHSITLVPGDGSASETVHGLRWHDVLKKVRHWASLVRREEAVLCGDALPPLVAREVALDPLSLRAEQKMRGVFLRKLYEIQKFERPNDVDVELTTVEDRIDADPAMLSRITDYLMGEHMIEWGTVGSIAITHSGVRYVENALLGHDPAPGVSSASIMQINNSGTLNVGALVQGSANHVQLSEVTLNNVTLADLALISNAINLLPPEPREEASEVLTDLKAELEAPSPKASRIKAFGGALMRLLEGVATNVVSDALKRTMGLS